MKTTCKVLRVYLTSMAAYDRLIVRIYLILFYIERGFHSRTEIGEKEIYRSTVHNISAVGNKTLFGCLPLPPLHNLIRGVIWSSTSLSPLSHLAPAPHRYPFGQFEVAAVDLEDDL
jgi:hypothetical protein